MKLYNSLNLNNLPLISPATYSSDEINELFDLSEEESVELTKVINDSHVAINKVYSNSKTEERLAEILIEANQFATEQLGKSNFLSIDIVTSTDEVLDDTVIYLIDDGSGTNTYNQYVLIGGNVTSLGSTQCDLTNYVTNDQLETKLEDYAKKNEVLSASDVVTTLDDTVTDEQLVGAKTIYDKTKDKNIKTFAYLSQIGLTVPCTVGEIFLALPKESIMILACEDIATSVTDVPASYGLLTIEKHYSGRFDIEYKTSSGLSVGKNRKWIGQLKGDDGSDLTWDEVAYVSEIVYNNAVVIEDCLDSLPQNQNWNVLFTNNGNTGELTDLVGLKLFCVEHRAISNGQMCTQTALYPSIGIVATRGFDWWTKTWGAWKIVCNSVHKNRFKDFTREELTAVSKTGLTITKARYYVKNGYATVFCAFSFTGVTINVANSISSNVPMFPPVQTSQDFTYAICKEKTSQSTCYGAVTTTGLFSVCFANQTNGTDFIYMATYPISETATIPTII